ncbi:MAG: hypothetical protein DLM73_08640 [Chthoniobacterales bacterium]|nr:MAG: hypothetical protein DLM73_08640 [Chthoniobacterales bacterium]
MKTSQTFAAIVALTVLIFAAAGTASAASPFKKVSGGTLHVSSGVIFPARVGAFRFEQTKIYGSDRDVGVEYDVVPLIRGDVYVYPLGTYAKDFNGEARVQQNAINKLYKGVKLVTRSRAQLNQSGRNLTGFRAQYELMRLLSGNKARRCGSLFYLFRDGRWLVAYRFSYPIEQSDAANKHIAGFMRLWQWRAQGNVVRLNPALAYASRG